MRPYKRSVQKRLDLTSVKDHTIDILNDDRAAIARKNKRRDFLQDSQDYGNRGYYPSGSGETAGRPEIQHQQSPTWEKFNQPRVLIEDRGVHRIRGRDKTALKNLRNAA